MVLVSGCRAQRSQQQSLPESTTSAMMNSKRMSSPGAGERQGSGLRRKKKTLVSAQGLYVCLWSCNMH